MSALTMDLERRHTIRHADRALARQIPDEAKRRETYQRVLTYRMTGQELVQACRRAVRSAHVPLDAQEDVSQDLAWHVVSKHGPEPIRAQVGAQWLRQCAGAFYLAHARRRETATGQSAIRAQTGDDPAYVHAATTPAPEMTTETPVAAIVSALAPHLTPRGADALRAVISPSSVPLSGSQRVALCAARKRIKVAYPTVGSLRNAIGD